jgi:hypothetical protein
MHVDEAGYVKGLETMLRKVINHRKYCEEWFYPLIETHLSTKDRALVDAELEDLVFS